MGGAERTAAKEKTPHRRSTRFFCRVAGTMKSRGGGGQKNKDNTIPLEEKKAFGEGVREADRGKVGAGTRRGRSSRNSGAEKSLPEPLRTI